MKKAFSLLEIIVVIAIVSILSSVGIYKLFFNFDTANKLEIQTQINLIKNAIVTKNNENILMNKSNELESLDNKPPNLKGQLLFSNVLTTPFISSNENEKEISKWIKLSQNSYKIYMSKTQSILFSYNSATATFDCDFTQALCKELYQ